MKRFPKFLLFFVFLLLVGAALVWFTPLRSYIPGIQTSRFTEAEYKQACKTLRNEALRVDDTKRKILLRQAISSRLFTYWEGTRWGFHGTTEIPGQGKIACGYFVTTLLRDCGVPLQRVTLAQQASEKIIKQLISEKHIRRYSKVALEDFVASVKKNGNQAYIIGLDTHVGFIVCENNEVFFVHSSGSYPWKVVKEEALESTVLRMSKYRITGCMTTDADFMKRWKESL